MPAMRIRISSAVPDQRLGLALAEEAVDEAIRNLLRLLSMVWTGSENDSWCGQALEQVPLIEGSMSYHTFFGLSAGLSKPLKCPKGTLESIMKHVASVESELSLETEQYLDNPPHWTFKSTRLEHIKDDETLCEAVQRHNAWVRSIYRRMGEWSEKPIEGGDTITPEDAKKFWHGLEMLDVKPERWSADYYRDRMDSLYEVMRGRPCDGITFDAKPLTTKQADAVIILFSEFLDRHDIRLAVPNGHDELKASCDGGYTWCEKCGAVDESDYGHCRKRKCPLRAECPEDF